MPLTNEQKLKYIRVILEECKDEELESVLVEVALEFLNEMEATNER